MYVFVRCGINLDNPAKNTWRKLKNLLFNSDAYILPKDSIVVSDGKNKKIISLSDNTTLSYIGKAINSPEKRKVGPKGTSQMAITLPEITQNIVDGDGFIQLLPLKLTSGQVIIVLSTPPHNGDENAC